MRRLPVIALVLPLLLVGACSRSPAPARAAAEPEDAATAECRAEARNSPEVRNIARQANSENATHQDRLNALRAEAQARALDECLRRRGLRRGGGVERVHQPGFWF